jgi:hypothetical protein
MSSFESLSTVVSHLHVVAVANFCPPPVLFEVANSIGVEK